MPWFRAGALAVAIWPVAVAAQGEEVDFQLVLAADVSGSMSRDELRVQKEGYVAALRSKLVAHALGSGALGTAALTYVEWAGAGEQKVVVPWTVVSSEGDLRAFANLVANGSQLRAATSATSLSSALAFGAALFDGNGFASYSRVIDISGDGPNDGGPSIEAIRRSVVSRGIVVNGLPIALDRSDAQSPYGFGPGDQNVFHHEDILEYFEESVIGGPGAFALGITDMDDFAEAMERKLVLEIALGDKGPRARQRVALLGE